MLNNNEICVTALQAIKGGATVGAVGADCPHWQEAVGAKLCFCPHKIWPSLIWKKENGRRKPCIRVTGTVGYDDARL